MKKITLTCAHAIVKYLIAQKILINGKKEPCLLYTSPSPRDYAASRMPSSA